MPSLDDKSLSVRFSVKEEEVAKLRGVFTAIDLNKDGHLSTDELRKALHVLGEAINPLTISAVVKACDKDGDGFIEFDEFVAIVAARSKHKAKKDNLMEVFAQFDANADGQISPEELQRAWTDMGEAISMQEAEAIVAEADVDGNGQVSFDEFVQMWKNM